MTQGVDEIDLELAGAQDGHLSAAPWPPPHND